MKILILVLVIGDVAVLNVLFSLSFFRHPVLHFSWVGLTYLLTYLITQLTYSMEQCPSWEANRFSSSQTTPLILWNPKVHHRIHKCPATVPNLNQIDPVHTPTSNILKIHFNIILPSMPGPSKWSRSLRFPHQNSAWTFPLLHTCYMSRLSHSSPFDNTNNIWRAKQNMKLLIM